jgi:hypothetical protein
MFVIQLINEFLSCAFEIYLFSVKKLLVNHYLSVEGGSKDASLTSPACQ